MSVCTSSHRTLPTAVERKRLNKKWTQFGHHGILWVWMNAFAEGIITLILQSMEEESRRWPEWGNSLMALTPWKTNRREKLEGFFSPDHDFYSYINLALHFWQQQDLQGRVDNVCVNKRFIILETSVIEHWGAYDIDPYNVIMPQICIFRMKNSWMSAWTINHLWLILLLKLFIRLMSILFVLVRTFKNTYYSNI